MALTLVEQEINGVNYKVFDVDGTGSDKGDIIVVEIEKGATFVPFIDQYALANIEWLDGFDDWKNTTLPESHPNYDLKEANFTTFADKLDAIQFPNGAFGKTVIGDYIVDFEGFEKSAERFDVVRGRAAYIAGKFKEIETTIDGL